MARKRNYPVTVWLSEKEMLILKDKISKTYICRSDYIRKCAIGKEIKVIPGIRELIIEIKRIGNSLDEITNSVNRGNLTIVGDNLKSIEEDLKAVWDKLAAIMKKL